MSQKAGRHPLNEAETGWFRTVHAHVQYNASGKLPYSWRSNGTQKYYLSQSELQVDRARSLRGIADDLARQGKSDGRPSDESLLELDSIVRELVSTTRLLHAEQRQLGIVTRDNVVWNGQQILLMDQGFYAPSDVYPQPPWLSEPPPDSQLWGSSIATQQAKALPNPQFASAEDVRLLIWLFQGLLLNVWRASLVTGRELRDVHKTQSMELWDCFRKLTASSPSAPPPSLDELEKVLSAHSLSDHFRSRGGRGGDSPAPGPSPLWLLLPPLIVAGGVGAAWHFRTWPFAPPKEVAVISGQPPAPVPAPREPMSVAEVNLPDPPALVDGSDSTTVGLESLAGQVTHLETLNDKLASGSLQIAEGDRNKIADYRERFLDQWSVSFPAALETFRHETTRENGFRTLTVLRDHLLNVHRLIQVPSNDTVKNKERQCFELLQTLRFDPRLPAGFRQSLLSSPPGEG